jgi:DNA-binding response OmpR family regulator
MMPKKDGFSLAEDVRKIDKNTPIIFLTARNQKKMYKRLPNWCRRLYHKTI